MRKAREKNLPVERAVKLVRRWKDQGKRVVFTNGCFDLLHPGHIRYLHDARRLGDALVVAVNSDASVRKLKGPGRPVQNERERAELLAALAAVDLVTIFDQPTPQELIAQMLPNVLVKGGDWPLDQIVGREEVETAGGRVISIPVSAAYSTSLLIETVREKLGSL